jgi:hypothetical protein
VADQDHGRTSVGEADQRLRSTANLVTVPGAASTTSVHMVWIRSMMARRGGARSPGVAMMSSAKSLQLDRRASETEPFGPAAPVRPLLHEI